MRNLISAGVLGIALLVPIGSASVLAQDGDAKDPVTAKLGGTEVRSSALLHLIQAQKAETRKVLREKPEALASLARSEALRQAVIASAKQAGFDKKPEVEISMRRSAEQALIERYLDFAAAPAAGFPDQESVEAAYKANLQAFSVSARVHLAQILLSVPVDASRKKSDAIGARAREVARLIEGPGAYFAAIAKQYSEDKVSAEKGGDVGWVDVATLPSEVQETIAPLALGAVSKPVRTRLGWQIFKLIERKQASVRPLAEMSADIAAALRRRKLEENKTKWLDALKLGGVVVEEPVLDEIRKKIE